MSSLAGVRRALTRELMRRDLRSFVEAAWPVMEPTRPLVRSVALDAITAALTATATGRAKRMAISCPPGVAKSKVAAVAYPAWLLLRSDGKSRVMSGSYAHDLAERDSRLTRDLVNSQFMRDLIGSRWNVREDVGNRVDDWSTTTTGRRLAVSTGGKTTGDRATTQVLDDLLNARDATSPTKRAEAIYWLNQVLPSRLEDSDNDPRVLIGQRLHVEDPIGEAIRQGWKLLVLPAVLGPCPELGIESETEPCILLDDDGREIWRDPRKPGEPLSSLLGIPALVRLKAELGSGAFAAQYLQAPHDDSTSMFPRSWFTRRWTELPERFDRVVVALDATFKESKSSDYAVISVWGALGGDRYLIEQWRRQAGFVQTLEALRDVMQRWRFAKCIVEAAANGHAIVDQLKREIPGVVAVKPEGGKVARAASIQAVCESGAIVLPANAAWVDAWLDEVSTFPGRHDDQVDSMVHGLRELQTSRISEPVAPEGGSENDSYYGCALYDDPVTALLYGDGWDGPTISPLAITYPVTSRNRS